MNAAAALSLKDRIPQVRGRVTEGGLLSNVTWFRVGGPADILFKPEDLADLQAFLAGIDADIRVTPIGVGSKGETLNINAEMNYWPAESCNLAECHEPLLRLVELLADGTALGTAKAQVLFRSEHSKIGFGNTDDQELLLGLVGSLRRIDPMHRLPEIHPAGPVVDRLTDVQRDPVAGE